VRKGEKTTSSTGRGASLPRGRDGKNRRNFILKRRRDIEPQLKRSLGNLAARQQKRKPGQGRRGKKERRKRGQRKFNQIGETDQRGIQRT